MRFGKVFGALAGTVAATIGAAAMFAAPALADEVPPEGQTAGTDISPIEVTELVGPERGASASGETCWTNSDFYMYVYNTLGQTIRQSHQYNDWCDMNGQVTRWLRNSQRGYGWAGWSFEEAYGGHTTQFPVASAWDNDDYRYRWLTSPIGSPTAIDYIHFTYRPSGHYGGTYGMGGG